MPLMSGLLVIAADAMDAALSEEFAEYCTPRTLMLGYLAFISSLKPWTRAPEISEPVALSMVSTDPAPPMEVPSWSAASAPPLMLSDWMLVDITEVSVRSPSMPMILMPASLACCSGTIMALGSVMEIMMASGLDAVRELMIAVCLSTAKFGSPWVVNVAPNRLASAAAPQDTEE